MGESILAEEQAVTMRGAGEKDGLEAEFGVGNVEGTLVLTDARLIFVSTDEKEEELPSGGIISRSNLEIAYSEVGDLQSIPAGSGNLFISVSDITSVVGHRGELMKPRLEVKWSSDGSVKGVEFSQVLTGKRKKNLDDWARVIQGLKSGTQKIVPLPPSPPIESLGGIVLRILADMRERGVLEIEEQVEEAFEVNLDPDEVHGLRRPE